VAVQTAQNDKYYISPQILGFHKMEHDEYHPFFFKPKTLSWLSVLLIVLNKLARSDFLFNLASNFVPSVETEEEMEDVQTKAACLGALCAFLCFASIHYPNTIMQRPHPIFWRVVLGLFSVYAVFMTYLFLLPLKVVQQHLKFFDPKLGKELPEVLYAEDCRLYTPENPDSPFAPLVMAVFDVHFVAHLLGWWVKMLICRDLWVAWICSVVFELLELTFRYWLPNFYECWWDSLLLDIFGCNLLGIVLGYQTLKYFGVKRQDWVAKKKPEGTCLPCDAPVRFFAKMMPASLQTYEWSGLQDVTHYMGVTVFCCMTLAVDCNNFFLKYLAWIPADHNIVAGRVILWGLVAIADSKEWYEYVTNPNMHRPGPFVWLGFYVCAIELSCVYKFRAD
jgi:phosphatidylserine synthase 2